MTRTAVVLLDHQVLADGKPASYVPIWDVPLIKRILIDLRRADVKNILLVSDRTTAELEKILDDTRRTNFERFIFAESAWKQALQATGDEDCLIVTADRLVDFRVLKAMAELRIRPETAVVLVDPDPANRPRRPERRFTVYDGALLPRQKTQPYVPIHAGACRLPVSAVTGLDQPDPDSLTRTVLAFQEHGRAAYFDIGNGFVEVIDSRQAARRAEARVIRYIWKATDGIHGRFNKTLILPVLKLLLRTPVTPNMISLLGVFVSLFSGYLYALGQYKYAVLGGLVAVASSLLDHLDGSIARIKSKDSPFGAHFDTVCDYVFYISFGVGSTIGLYRASGSSFYIWIAIALVFGVLVSLIVMTYERAHRAKDPSNLAVELHKKLDQNAGNRIISLGRSVYFVARRPALPYYLLFFTVIGLLPFVLFMTALGTNLFWMFHVYSASLLSPRSKVPAENQ